MPCFWKRCWVLLVVCLWLSVYLDRSISSTRGFDASYFDYDLDEIDKRMVCAALNDDLWTTLQWWNNSNSGQLALQNNLRSRPSLKVCVLTRMTSSVRSYGVWSYLVQSLFTRLHYGYVMIPLFPDSVAEDYEYHRKLTNILELLDDDRMACDYVMWMDAGMSTVYLSVCLCLIVVFDR
jgi:hypothetical protein